MYIFYILHDDNKTYLLKHSAKLYTYSINSRRACLNIKLLNNSWQFFPSCWIVINILYQIPILKLGTDQQAAAACFDSMFMCSKVCGATL